MTLGEGPKFDSPSDSDDIPNHSRCMVRGNQMLRLLEASGVMLGSDRGIDCLSVTALISSSERVSQADA